MNLILLGETACDRYELLAARALIYRPPDGRIHQNTLATIELH
jgi:hypothetical protein